ncbi:MAG: hypothetical protein FWG65_10645 [Turicibacter sp.]|nr:hypothetical protein [Turicibacter sp.]
MTKHYIDVYEIAANEYKTVKRTVKYPDSICIDDGGDYLWHLDSIIVEHHEKDLVANRWNLSEEDLAKQIAEFTAYYGYEPANPPQELLDFRQYPLNPEKDTYYDEVPEKWLKAPCEVLEIYKEFAHQQGKLYKAKRRAEQRAKQQAKSQAKTALA